MNPATHGSEGSATAPVLYMALELSTSEKHANNVSLASIIQWQRARVPVEVPAQKKTA